MDILSSFAQAEQCMSHLPFDDMCKVRRSFAKIHKAFRTEFPTSQFPDDYNPQIAAICLAKSWVELERAVVYLNDHLRSRLLKLVEKCTPPSSEIMWMATVRERQFQNHMREVFATITSSLNQSV